ncbi:hypothetical protein [Legionella sp. W05-934-2]|uniref:hypothetical protein n=1 Tax=Legionella sp. W05-934-2 TaxID=1198649 RepID=UPI0034637B76
MYTKQNVDELVAAFVKKHIQEKDTKTLRQHVLQEKVFIQLCESNLYPLIEKNYKDSLQDETAKLEKKYYKKQHQLDQKEIERLTQLKNDNQDNSLRCQKQIQQYKTNIFQLEIGLNDNSSNRDLARRQHIHSHPATSDPNHHGRESQSDTHHHGRDSQTSSHTHGREEAPDLSRFDQIERELRQKILDFENKIMREESNLRRFEVESSQLQEQISAINFRQQRYNVNNDLKTYLSESHYQQLEKDRRNLEQTLTGTQNELKRHVQASCHACLLESLRSHLNSMKSASKLDESQTGLLRLVEAIFQRKEDIAQLKKQLTEMRSRHQKEKDGQEKVVLEANKTLLRQQTLCTRLDQSIFESEQFLLQIPQQIQQLELANQQLKEQEETFQRDHSDLEKTARKANSTYAKVKGYCMPIIYASVGLAAVSVIPLVIASAPAWTIASLVTLSLSALSVLVAGGVNIGYSLNASWKQSAFESNTTQIREKQQGQFENVKKIMGLQDSQIKLPDTIEKGKQSLATENETLEKNQKSLQDEQKKLREMVKAHKQAESQLEAEIKQLKDKPIDEGEKVSHLSIFASPTQEPTKPWSPTYTTILN